MADSVIPRRMRSVISDTPIVQQTERSDLNEKKLALKAELSKEILKRSPFLLGKHVLGFDRFTDPHKQWDKFCRNSIDFTCQRSSKTLVLQPRETFKSTFWTTTVAIEILLNNPNASIFIVSATSSTSTQILGQIKNHLANNTKLTNTFGSFYNKDHWSQTSITITQRVSLNQKEPSILALGKGAFVTGMHPDVIIWDDVVGPQDRVSKAERDATLRYFQDCWDLLKKDTGQFIVTGTRYHRNDIYAHILSLNKQLDKKFECLVTPAVNKDGSLNFPTILSQAKLDELRTVKQGKDTLDVSSFSCQYLLDPIDEAENIFKTFHYVDLKQLLFDVCIMFCDPAMSQTGCYSAIVALAKINNGEYKNKWCTIETSLEKRSPTKLMNDFINLHKFVTDTYKCDIACYMEQNGFQALLKDNIMKSALENGYSLPITGRTTTQNKLAKIAALEPYISQGHILFRNDWQTASGNYKVLLEQLKGFPNEEFDGPDALAMAQIESRSRYFNMELTT